MYFDLFTFSYFSLLLVIVCWALLIFVRWRLVRNLAGEVYDSNVEKNLLDGKIPRDEYIRSYCKAESPRLAIYQCGVALLAWLLLPILISVFTGAIENMNIQSENWGLRLGRVRIAGIAGDFLGFILVMGCNIAMLAAATFLYYRRRPPTLKAEIKRLEEIYS